MATTSGVKTCPACAQQVSPLWTTCRGCGALLIAPPGPVPTFGAPVAEAHVPAPDTEQFYVRAPLMVRPPARQPRSYLGIGIAAFVVIALAVGGYSIVQSRGHTRPAPSVLAPRPASPGVPSGLAAITRQQAESTRHFAIQAVAQLGSDNGDITLHALGQMQPGFQWVAGDQPSTTYSMVSLDDTQGIVTVAVSTPSKEVCAFGRWSSAAGPSYVSMANMPQCRAIDAPTSGWSSEPGGAASDLPDASG